MVSLLSRRVIRRLACTGIEKSTRRRRTELPPVAPPRKLVVDVPAKHPAVVPVRRALAGNVAAVRLPLRMEHADAGGDGDGRVRDGDVLDVDRADPFAAGLEIGMVDIDRLGF